MRLNKRKRIPKFLADNASRWNAAHVSRHGQGFAFRWSTLNGKPANRLLLPHLIAMTLNHCSYCDGFPLGETSRRTIDHFKPASKFPHLAYQWENLFICCDVCQQRLDAYDNLLLKPDAADYSFKRYFQFNPSTGRIVPNPQGTARDRECAKITIRLFDFNNWVRRNSRLRFFKIFKTARISGINDRPFRFLFE